MGNNKPTWMTIDTNHEQLLGAMGNIQSEMARQDNHANSYPIYEVRCVERLLGVDPKFNREATKVVVVNDGYQDDVWARDKFETKLRDEIIEMLNDEASPLVHKNTAWLNEKSDYFWKGESFYAIAPQIALSPDVYVSGSKADGYFMSDGRSRQTISEEFYLYTSMLCNFVKNLECRNSNDGSFVSNFKPSMLIAASSLVAESGFESISKIGVPIALVNKETNETLLEFTFTGQLSLTTPVEFFFTQKAAENYIEQNRHNLDEPFVYVNSAYNNPELRAVMSGLATLPFDAYADTGLAPLPTQMNQQAGDPALPSDSVMDYQKIREDKVLLLKSAGYDIVPDSDQPGLWVWTAGNEGCEMSFNSEEEAIDAAWNDLCRVARDNADVSVGFWDGLTFKQQCDLVNEHVIADMPQPPRI